MTKSKKWLILLLLLAMAAGGAWFGRTPALTWYYLRGLEAATDTDRELWVTRVVSLDKAALPGLRKLLQEGNPAKCAGAAMALSQLLKNWGSDGPATQTVLNESISEFPTLSEAGREAVLELQLALLAGAAPSQESVTTKTATRLLLTAAHSPEPGVRLRVLALAEMLVDGAAPGTVDMIVGVVRQGLESPDPEQRVRAIRLTLHGKVTQDGDLLARVVPLLKDQVAEVRRAALVALGYEKQLVSEEALLPLLHDGDAKVRSLCELALRSRGVTDQQMLVGWMISHENPGVRLGVVLHLRDDEDLEPGVWLRRLSHDASPAVRAASLRGAAARPDVDFSGRAQEMQQNDPAATVRELAGYYLRQR